MVEHDGGVASMSKASVLVVDDHPIVALGLKIILQDNPDFAICGEADSVASAYEKIGSLNPAIVILDLLLGYQDATALIRTISKSSSGTRIVIYSCQHEQMAGARVLRAGAHGYVSKIDGLPQIEKALAAVSRGDFFFDGAARRERDFAQRHGAKPALQALSEREKQVLRLTGQGLSLQRIAQKLALSAKTVGTYRERLKIKLGVDRVQELIWLSQDLIAQNLIEPGPKE